MLSSSDRPSTPGRRIVSRLSSPFTAAKTRHIPEFSVKPDDEHKEYSPGDLVSGHVRLRVAKAIRVTHVVVRLHGFVQVYKHPGSPIEGPRHSHGQKSGDSIANGFASLFEDEVVLCGDGRLAEGAYQFNFELEFPDRSLPSSIDFERGTISYMVTAILTRPTSMAPVISHDRKIRFLERIDVSSLYPPKARTITLAPLSKRSRTRIPTQRSTDTSDKGSRISEARDGPDGLSHRDLASISSTLRNSRGPTSPVPSEISFATRLSNSRRASQPDDQSLDSSSRSDVDKGSESKSSLSNKVITVTVESLVGGCLRGDYIPIKIDISHIKPIRSSSYGVIITLFRQGRVDMRPSIPLGPVEKGKESKSEEYYTKSFTGMGGLSLSGAGNSRVFRRELAQSIWPLFIDLPDLTSEINARIRVPDEVEVFPTISTVPGSMINFKYYLEVVVDIQGKLQGEKGLPGMSNQGFSTNAGDAEDRNAERSAFNPMGSTFVDTAPIRRDKGVVTCTFEVVIGTKDSERKKGKRKMKEATPQPEPQPTPGNPNTAADANVDWYGTDEYGNHSWYDDYYGYHYYPQHGYYHPSYAEPPYDPPPPAVPIPQMPDEAQMTEKERIQQAEERLLPSQPPGVEPAQDDNTAGATAPQLPEEAQYAEDISPSAATGPIIAGSSSSAYLPDRLVTEENQHAPVLAAPRYTPQASATSNRVETSTNDDQQELLHQRLEAETSAPTLETYADHEPLQEAQPLVPSLAEVANLPASMHDSHADANASTDLPRYER